MFSGHRLLLSPAGPGRAGLGNGRASFSAPARAGSAGTLPLGCAGGWLHGGSGAGRAPQLPIHLCSRRHGGRLEGGGGTGAGQEGSSALSSVTQAVGP